MAETHELRLKIDAAAAKTGSRVFVAAVEAVKQAVRGLERDSAGAFTNLRKQIKSVSASGNVKIGVDKQSLRDLNSYAAAHAQISKSASVSEKSVKSLTRVVGALSAAYRSATATADQFSASILRTNSALMRQIQLASLARSAVGQVRTAPMAANAADTQTVRQPRAARIVSPDGAPSMKDAAAGQQAIQRAIATSRTEVERLTTSLMKMGGFGAMSQLHRDFQAFSAAATRSGVTTRELASAKERFATATANARTSVVTLTAKTMDEARAASALAKASNDAAQAAKARASAQISASAATRAAEADAMRLSARLREMGDTKGVNQINQALITLKSNLSGGARGTMETRAAMESFAQATSNARSTLQSHEAGLRAAKRESSALAAEKRKLSDAARNVEREMRSIAGANAAVSRSFREATGNMRGLENAFSATFQAGSLFRNMIGSITFGTFTSGVFRAGDALDQFSVAMEVARGSSRKSMEELAYIDSTAGSLGISLDSARSNYAKFAVSASIAGVEARETQKIFDSVSTALSVMGKSTVDQNLVFMALEQMMSKGVVSSEELRQQLGERLPGAVNLMAEALGVSMKELQKMLQAGEIVSSDALPKFAEVLMERFGPGLEAATKRAGNNLQKLRNEIQLFIETVAKSGFMNELAMQFRMLTEVMASGAAANAARRLGEALANGARIGGQAVMWMVENLDTLGAVLKAVGVGIVARQLLNFAQAASTATMQIAGYIASWATGTQGLTAAEMATKKHTMAVEANTAALARNAVATARGSTTTGAFAVSQERASKQAMTTARHTAAVSGAMSMLGASAGKAAAGAGMLARGLSIIAPVAGFVVTGLLLIPGAFEAIGLGADDASVSIDAALARSGAKFSEFGDIVRENTSVGMMKGLLTDLTVLESVVSNISTRSSGGIFAKMLGVSDIDALTLATGQANLQLTTMQGIFARIGTWAGGVDSSTLAGPSAAAAKDIFNMYQRVHSGQATAVELQAKIDDAIIRFPHSAPFFSVWEGLNRQMLQAEQGVVNTTRRMTDLFGTSDEQALVGFVKLAEQVYNTGEGMDALKARQKELAESSPHLAATLDSVMKSWDNSFRMGDSSLAWAKSVESVYNSTANNIKSLRDGVVQANTTFGTSLSILLDETNKISEKLGTTQYTVGTNAIGAATYTNFVDPVPVEVLDSYKTLVEQFAQFQSGDGLGVGVEKLTLFTDQLKAGTPAVSQFVTAVMSQFGALSQSEQTYTRMDTILRATASRYPQLSAEVAIASEKIRDHARAGNTSAMAFTDLEKAIASLPWPSQDAENSALAMAQLALNAQLTGDKAREASGGLYDATGGANAIGAAADAAAARVRALASALASMGAVGADFSTKAVTIAADIKFQTELKAMESFKREGAKYRRDAETALMTERNSALEQAGSANDVRAINRRYEDQLKAIRTGQDIINQAALEDYNTEAWKDPKTAAKGGGGGGGRVEDLGDESRQLSKISKQLNDRIFALERENSALNLLAEGKVRTKEGAEAMAMALEINNGKLDAATEATIRAYEANVLLNEQLQRDAKDPFRDYIQSLPSAIEATKQLKTSLAQVFESGLTDMFMGEFDAKKIVDDLRRNMAQMLAQRTMKMLFGNLFDSSGIEMASSNGARQMQTGIVMGAQQGAQMFAAALTGAAMPAGGAGMMGGLGGGFGLFGGGGGMGGGFGLLGGLFSLFGFAEGGYSDRPGMSTHRVSPAAFKNAPHYSEGTSNTSGIPAVLHPNEAVVPLTKGRKIPVDASGMDQGGQASLTSVTIGDINVEIKTEKSIEDEATATQAAKNVADMIKQQVTMQMAEAAQYGGLMNPRGT